MPRTDTTPTIPSDQEARLAREASRGIETQHADMGSLQLQLAKAGKEATTVRLPEAAAKLLLQVLTEMGDGADLNRSLRGWLGTFKQAHPTTFSDIDKMIRRRLRGLLRKQEKRPSAGYCRDDHRRWPNAFFATAGLFALHTACQTARQSR